MLKKQEPIGAIVKEYRLALGVCPPKTFPPTRRSIFLCAPVLSRPTQTVDKVSYFLGLSTAGLEYLRRLVRRPSLKAIVPLDFVPVPVP